MKHPRWIPWFVIPALAAATVDGVTRAWARAALDPQHATAVLGDLVQLRLSFNPGPAFGFMPQRWLLAGLMVLAAVALVDGLRHALRHDVRVRGLLICAGLTSAAWLVGLERGIDGRTTDFIVLRWGSQEWPGFNLGDVFLQVGAWGAALFVFILPPQSRRWRRRLGAARHARALKGTLVRLVGLGVFSVGVTLVTMGNLAAAIQTSRSPWFLTVFVAGSLGVGAVLIYVAALLQIYGRRLQHPALEELLRVDTRPPVLFLRRFQRDRARIPAPSRWGRFALWRLSYAYDMGPWTFERALSSRLEEMGPVVALGDPDESGPPPLGAARTPGGDAGAWQGQVTALAARASMIAILMEHSPSMRWELAEVVRVRGLDRVLLVLLPARVPGHDALMSRQWNDLREAFPFLPPISATTAAIAFDAAATPRTTSYDGADVWGHLRAVEALLRTMPR